MRNYLAIALVLLGSSCAATPVKRPFLWEIEKDGKTSHILGTQHSGIRYSELPPSVYEKVDAAKSVYTECEPPALRETTPTPQSDPFYFRHPGDAPAKERLSPAARAYLDKKLSGGVLGLDPEALSPAGIAAILVDIESEPIQANLWTQRDWNPALGIDRYVHERAKSHGKPIGYLDRPEGLERLRICINHLGLLEIEARAAGKPQWKFPSQEELRAERYRSGDESQIVAPIKMSPQERECALTYRNAAWIPVIEAAHAATAPAFFAMGVAHAVGGTDDVLTLLKNRGFRVKRAD